MSSNCNNGVTSNYKPGAWSITGLLVGFSYPFTHEFKGAGVDITNDDFSIVVKLGASVIKTLTVGDGLTIEDETHLSILIGSPITAAAGTYSMTVIRTDDATGTTYPYAVGSIKVSP